MSNIEEWPTYGPATPIEFDVCVETPNLDGAASLSGVVVGAAVEASIEVTGDEGGYVELTTIPVAEEGGGYVEVDEDSQAADMTEVSEETEGLGPQASDIAYDPVGGVEADRASAARLEEFYTSNQGALLNKALKLSNFDRTAAEDLLQETLERAHKSRNTFRPGTNYRAWIYRIMTNAQINHYRAAKRRPKETSLDAIEEGVHGIAAGPRGLSDRAELAAEEGYFGDIAVHRIVGDTIGLLNNKDHQRIIYLVDVVGFEYKEAAKALGVPVGTVMSRLHRARKALKKEPAVRKLWSDTYGPLPDGL